MDHERQAHQFQFDEFSERERKLNELPMHVKVLQKALGEAHQEIAKLRRVADKNKFRFDDDEDRVGEVVNQVTMYLAAIGARVNLEVEFASGRRNSFELQNSLLRDFLGIR